MASIYAGLHTVREVFNAANFDFEAQAAADYNSGAPDYRRVKISGLGFDDLGDTVNIPVTIDEVVITLDGAEVARLDVALTDEQRGLRAYSFATAAEAEGSFDDPEVPARFKPVEPTEE